MKEIAGKTAVVTGAGSGIGRGICIALANAGARVVVADVDQAGAEAVEISESALAYREAKVSQAQGEAARFEALLAAYQDAKAVTRQRLYFEAIEDFLPDVEKILIEPDTVQMLPMMSLPRFGGQAPTLPDGRPGASR